MGFSGLLVLVMTSISLSSDSGVAALCSSPYCPPPWHAFKEHCYMWVNITMSCVDAERHCQMLSHPGTMVHLASIHSKEEDEFMKDYVRSASGPAATSSYWIGYSDIEREGRFQWSDGSDVTYERWQPSEPNSFEGTDEDCVERRPEFRHEWNDNMCNENNQFFCKL